MMNVQVMNIYGELKGNSEKLKPLAPQNDRNNLF